MSKRIIYYYQDNYSTPDDPNDKASLEPVLAAKTPTGSPVVNVITVSSIHFGTTTGPDGSPSPYIHLNNKDPDVPGFDRLWDQTKTAHELGITVTLMVGGAGGAYKVLFSDFKKYYGLLKNTLKARPWITGINLDVEEHITLEDIQKLINALDTDMGPDFIIAMAPVASSLMSDGDGPGIGGFSYKKLYESSEGKRINWFNGQFYSSWGGFSYASYQQVMQKGGYPPSKVVMGMLASDFPPSTFDNALETVKKLVAKHADFGGVSVWLYNDAPPSPENPVKWAESMWQAMH